MIISGSYDLWRCSSQGAAAATEEKGTGADGPIERQEGKQVGEGMGGWSTALLCSDFFKFNGFKSAHQVAKIDSLKVVSAAEIGILRIENVADEALSRIIIVCIINSAKSQRENSGAQAG